MKEIPMLNLRLEYEYMKEDIDSAIKRCLEHQKWILGPEVKELEQKVAEYIGVKHCVGVSSGTDALVLSLRALAIRLKGQEYFDRTDKIITTPFTFTATGDAILRAGATPVFVDIDPATYNIDPQKIRECLAYSHSPVASSPANVVGILPVHLYGQACNMDEIMTIAKEHNLFVVEDVAQAFGGIWKEQRLGSIGTLGTFSFFPSKNLGGFGDGGMVSTNDDDLAELVRMLLKHGGKDKYNVDHIGYNARLDTLQSAILLAKLKYVEEFNQRRRKIAGLYNEGLKDFECLVLPIAHSLLPLASNKPPIASNNHVFHQYTIRLVDVDRPNRPDRRDRRNRPNEPNRRDEFQTYLRDKKVSTMVYYPIPLHKMSVFESCRGEVSGSLRNAEYASQNVLSLPVEPLQRKEEILYVVSCIKEFYM